VGDRIRNLELKEARRRARLRNNELTAARGEISDDDQSLVTGLCGCSRHLWKLLESLESRNWMRLDILDVVHKRKVRL